jgi:hypothetical protein
MKKYFPLFLISFILFGCSSIELEAVSTSEEETQRILALGLSHEENLIEAKKLKSNHMISVVTLQLTNARDEKIQDDLDLVESAKYSELVEVSDINPNFIGSKVEEAFKKGVLEEDVEIQTYFLSSNRNENGILQHKLNVSIEYNSSNTRTYLSANLCDKWMRCDGVTSNALELEVTSSKGTNCSTTGCNFIEEMELNLNDDFLRDFSDTGFTIRFNSKKKFNKIKVSKAYLMGYLKVVK